MVMIMVMLAVMVMVMLAVVCVKFSVVFLLPVRSGSYSFYSFASF